MEIQIEGMKCDGCVSSVTNALKGIDGVEDVKVSLEDALAKISSSVEIDQSKINQAIQAAGFKVK